MTRTILSDENCEGQAEAIFRILEYHNYVEMLSLVLNTLPEVGLRKGIGDEAIWRYCQAHECFLLTGNRTADDGTESLEYTVRRLVTPQSIPVLTISNPKRIPRDGIYLERCAHMLAEIVFDLDDRYRGITRLYLS